MATPPNPAGRPKGRGGGGQGRLHGRFTLLGEGRLVEARLSGLNPDDSELALRSRQSHFSGGMLDDPVGAFRVIPVCHHHDSVDTIENRAHQTAHISVRTPDRRTRNGTAATNGKTRSSARARSKPFRYLSMRRTGCDCCSNPKEIWFDVDDDTIEPTVADHLGDPVRTSVRASSAQARVTGHGVDLESCVVRIEPGKTHGQYPRKSRAERGGRPLFTPLATAKSTTPASGAPHTHIARSLSVAALATGPSAPTARDDRHDCDRPTSNTDHDCLPPG